MRWRLEHLLAFDAPVSVSDGQGGTLEGWSEQFRTRAGIRYLRGTEPVMAARLSGVQPLVIGVRANAQTLAVTNRWRARFALRGSFDAQGDWDGDVIDLMTFAPSDDHRFVEITAKIGVTA